jgi:hypothetical protein
MMGSVETLGVDAIDVPHASGHVGIRGLNEKMVMSAEQAISGNAHIPQIRRFFQKINKGNIVVFSQENGFCPSASIHDMVPASAYRILSGLDMRSRYHLYTDKPRADPFTTISCVGFALDTQQFFPL